MNPKKSGMNPKKSGKFSLPRIPCATCGQAIIPNTIRGIMDHYDNAHPNIILHVIPRAPKGVTYD